MKESKSKRSSDVVIVGGGYIGALTALLLSRSGISATLFESSTQIASTLEQSLGVFWPSPNDPPTRAQVAHGTELALFLNEFSATGIQLFERTIAPMLFSAGGYEDAECLRIALEDFETTELEQAAKLKLGLTSYKSGLYKERHRALAIEAGEMAAALRRTLKKSAARIRVTSTVQSIIETSSGCTVRTADGDVVHCEIVIVCANENSGTLLPSLKDVFVPMTDIATSYLFACKKLEFQRNNLCIRNGNGHVALRISSKEGQGKLAISGPRFFLPFAGAGVDLVSQRFAPESIREKLDKFHKKKVFPKLEFALGTDALSNLLNSNATPPTLKTDCLPCDELPLLGEAGRLGKVLCTGGWLANGFSSGAHAAYALLQLVQAGRYELAHPMLSPQRFFR